MAETRDPRRDPRPGDVVEKGKFARHVEYIGFVGRGVRVHYRTGRGKHDWAYLEPWVLWARNATVLHAAPEEPTR